MSFLLATRGSPLALRQAEAVKTRLRAAVPNLDVTLLIVRTESDGDTSSPRNAHSLTGVFTKDVDQAVLEGRASAAVHSLKDQPTTLPSGIWLGAVLPRGPVEDVVVCRTAARFLDLESGSRVATGTALRRAQLACARPDLCFVDIGGNVESRLTKLDRGDAEALVLAQAGLVRLGLQHRITEVLSTDLVFPAPSQALIGVTCRVHDAEARGILLQIEDPEGRVAAVAERAFLGQLGSGCNVPAGTRTTLTAGRLRLEARILNLDGTQLLAGEREGRWTDALAIGRGLAEQLLAQGAQELLKECRG